MTVNGNRAPFALRHHNFGIGARRHSINLTISGLTLLSTISEGGFGSASVLVRALRSRRRHRRRHYGANFEGSRCFS